MQKAVSSLAEPLTKLFNKCIDANKYPTNWKTAIVTPVFKKGDSSDLNNYRDILIPLNKVFEKILAAQIRNYFESNNLFF